MFRKRSPLRDDRVLKIAHFTTSFVPANIGGKEIAVFNLAKSQQDAGHDVTVVTRWRHWRLAKASNMPFPIRPLLPKPGHLKTNGRANAGPRVLQSFQIAYYQLLARFDVWHVHAAYPAGYLALPILRCLRVPSVLTCQGDDIQKFPEIGYGYRLEPGIERRIVEALQSATAVTAISNSVRSEIESLGIPAHKIYDIPNGANFARIQNHNVDRAAVRKRLGWPPNKSVILSVGRNHPKKGYNLIPEIILALRERRDDFIWVIVGHDTASVSERAKDLGVDKFLRCIDQIGSKSDAGVEELSHLPADELVDIYKAADIFGFPSLLEGFGLVFLEAWAAGLAIATTDAPGCRDVVTHGQNGLISPAGDTQQMAANLDRLIGDDDLRGQIAKNGEFMAHKYEWSEIGSAHLNLYRDLCSTNTE